MMWYGSWYQAGLPVGLVHIVDGPVHVFVLHGRDAAHLHRLHSMPIWQIVLVWQRHSCAHWHGRDLIPSPTSKTTTVDPLTLQQSANANVVTALAIAFGSLAGLVVLAGVGLGVRWVCA